MAVIDKAPKVPGELQPNAAIDMLLDFVTTTEARPFTVQFIDPKIVLDENNKWTRLYRETLGAAARNGIR